MAYFAAVKITDINGNVIELSDISDILEEIRDELKVIALILNEIAESNITKEDISL